MEYTYANMFIIGLEFRFNWVSDVLPEVLRRGTELWEHGEAMPQVWTEHPWPWLLGAEARPPIYLPHHGAPKPGRRQPPKDAG